MVVGLIVLALGGAPQVTPPLFTGTCSGVCWLPLRAGPPPGLMFLALGLVGLGLVGLARERRAGS